MERNIYDTLKHQAWRYLEYKLGTYTSMNTIIQRELEDINQKALSKAVDSLVSRHESLRTLFLDRGGEVFQKVVAETEFSASVSFDDISSQKSKNEKINIIIKESVNYLFDFQKEPSFKCKLIKYEKNKYVFIFVIDHIISDFYSLKIIEEELLILYNCYDNGIPSPLEPLKNQFRDYVSYQAQHYSGDKLVNHESYFKNLLNNIPPKLKIKFKNYSPKEELLNQDFGKQINGISIKKKGGRYVFMIPKETSDQIQVITSELKISFFNFLLTSYCIFLSRISDQTDFIIDSPMSTRNNKDFSKIIGWMSGALISRVKINDEATFVDLLFYCRDIILEAIDHVYYLDYGPLLNVDWDQLVSSTFNVIYDDNTVKDEIEDFNSQYYENETVWFDIAFTIRIFQNGILVNCLYKDKMIDKLEISKICKEFLNVLNMAIDFPTTKMIYWNKEEALS